SAELEAAILKALAKDPKGRWQTAEELSAALAKVPEMQGQPSSVDSRPLPQQKAAPRTASAAARANLVPWAIAGGLALLLVIGVVAARRPATPSVTKTTAAAGPATTTTTTTAARRQVALGAQRHLAQAVDFQRRLWCSDALEELDKALRDDEELRGDLTLQR